jgi:uncharacterized protein involved in outer membrane biogenesis
MAVSRPRKWAVGLGVFAVLVAALVLLFDWNWFKPILEARAGGILLRQVRIGNLHVALLPHPLEPAVTIDDISIANPEGFPPGSQFGTIKRIALTVDLPRLVRGTLRMDELAIIQPRAHMADNAQGRRNWDFTNPDKKVHVAHTRELPEIGVLTIEDGDISLTDRKLDADAKFKIATQAVPNKEPEIVATGNGRYAGDPFALNFRGASLLSLRDQDRPYPFYLKVQIGQSTSVLTGNVTRPLANAGYKMDLELTGPSLSKLFPIIGIPSPPTPPYDLKGSLEYEGTTFRFTNFRGRVGESDLAGNVVFQAGGDRRPDLQADLTSNKLVLADLKGFIGALPGRPESDDSGSRSDGGIPDTGKGGKAEVAPNPSGGTQPQTPGPAPVANPKEPRQPFVQRPGKMLPDMPMDLEQVRAIDARVSFRGHRVQSEDLPVDDLAVDMVLKDGRLKLIPVKFGIAKGHVALNIDIDANKDPAAVATDVEFREVDIHRLMKQTGMFEGFGTFGGRAALKTRGNSVAEMLGRADGELVLVMAGGSFSALLSRLAQLDVLKSLGIAAGDPKRQVAIRCVVADLPIENGIMKVKVFVFDTDVDVITAEGQINLRDEMFDLTFKPHPKSPSIGSLKAPLKVTGPFVNPSVMPDPAVVAAKGAAAVALGVLLTPVGALIPTIELGLGKDSDCRGLIQQAQQAVPPPQTQRPPQAGPQQRSQR